MLVSNRCHRAAENGAAIRFIEPRTVPRGVDSTYERGVSDLNGAPAGHGFEGRLSQPECLATIPWARGHRGVFLQRLQERVQLVAIGIGVALKKEVEQRLLRLGFMRAVAPNGAGTQVVVE